MTLKFDPFSAFHDNEISDVNREPKIFYLRQINDAHSVLQEALQKVKEGDEAAQSTVDIALEIINTVLSILTIPGRNLVNGDKALEERENLMTLTSFLAGYQVARLAIDVNTDPSKEGLEEFKKMIASASGKKAVSQREDQLLKPSWMEHVRSCVAKGIKINNIGDLLNVSGYSSNISRISPKTLKAWAKEASPAIKFKSGRPKN